MAMVRNSVGAGWCHKSFSRSYFFLVKLLKRFFWTHWVYVVMFSQIVTWLMSCWKPKLVPKWEWETQTPRAVWWWWTCSVRWRRRWKNIKRKNKKLFVTVVSYLCLYRISYWWCFHLSQAKTTNKAWVDEPKGAKPTFELVTIATLTGHAIRAVGPNYSVSKGPLSHDKEK